MGKAKKQTDDFWDWIVEQWDTKEPNNMSVMSKFEADAEAERLALYLKGKTRKGDRVIVMVHRSDPDNLSYVIGVSSVDKHPDKDQWGDLPLTKKASIRKASDKSKRKPKAVDPDKVLRKGAIKERTTKGRKARTRKGRP